MRSKEEALVVVVVVEVRLWLCLLALAWSCCCRFDDMAALFLVHWCRRVSEDE